MDIYWQYWTAIELRGGGGRVFYNVIESSSTIWLILTDYGYTATWPNFGGICQCPSDYPVKDQIGVGIDPKSAASEPMYLWNNTKNGAPVSFIGKSTDACTGTCGTFTMSDVIKKGRDYFESETKPAEMNNYTPYGTYLNGRYYHPLQRAATPSMVTAPRNLKII
jgi:hypothetical protein